eukprot:14005000-Heterocapsa_arctica.AAC.1
MVAALRHAGVCSKAIRRKARFPGRPVQVKASGPTDGMGVNDMGKQASNLDAFALPHGAESEEQVWVSTTSPARCPAASRNSSARRA